MEKPFSPACERNRAHIYEVLQSVFASSKNVLEIGSGTGQHAVYFAERMPWLNWQCSDVDANLSGIQLWIDETELSNLPEPIELDVNQANIQNTYDGVFTANTLHIMSAQEVERFFQLLAKVTKKESNIVIYGPFNYNGNFTSASNAAFDQQLKINNPASGIRDFEWIQSLANSADFKLVKDYKMPANNRCLHFST